MAYDLSNGNAAPGLIWEGVPSVVETGLLKEDKNSEGGFVLWGKEGEGDNVYITKPSDGAYFKGIAVRKTVQSSFEAGDTIGVMKKGRIWVKALGECLSGQKAYISNANNGITAASTDGTEIVGGTFTSNAADGQLVELEIL